MDRPRISIHRPACTLRELHRQNGINQDPDQLCASKKRSCFRKNYSFNHTTIRSSLMDRLPFINMLANYKWKKYIIPDVIAGLSVGVIHIPLGMGLALLTEVPPVYGLYTSIFPVWIYFLFGTSRHLGMGPLAPISLMIGSVVNRQVLMRDKATANTDTMGTTSITQVNNGSVVPDDDESLVEFKVGIATSVTLIAGLFQLLLFLFRLDVVASYMSRPFVDGFTVGFSIQALTSLLATALGINIPRTSGTFSLFRTYIDLFSNIGDTNIASLVVSVVSIIYLIVIKEYINVKCRRKIKYPIPAELFLLIIATVLFEYTNLKEKYSIHVVGSMNIGFPKPKMPSMNDAGSYVVDGILVGMVTFTISLTMAKIIGAKHNHSISARQEMLAYGLQNCVSSFFQSFASTQAPSRTLVHESVGGKSQIAHLISTILPLVLAVAFGPLFRSLPNAILSSVIISALLPLLKKFSDLPMYWRVNVYDFIVWVATLISVVLFSLAIGLFVGMGCGIVLMVIQTQLVKGYTLVSQPFPDIHIPSRKRHVADTACMPPNVTVFRFESNIYFANVESFKNQILALTNKTLSEDTVVRSKHGDDKYPDASRSPAEPCEPEARQTDRKSSTIVLDCSAINYIDIMGINLLTSLANTFENRGIRLCLAACGTNMTRNLKNGGLGLQEEGISGKSEEVTQQKDDGCPQQLILYPTVHDAVAYASGNDTEVAITIL